MDFKINIKYHWILSEPELFEKEDNEPLEKHIEALNESAQERIFEMLKQGHIYGELNDNIIIDDEDEKLTNGNGVEYTGRWQYELLRR